MATIINALEAAGVELTDYPLCTLKSGGFSDDWNIVFHLENRENDDYALRGELPGLLADYSSAGLPFTLTVWLVKPD